MGSQIRRVPKNWQHPKKENGQYQPMFHQYYLDALNEWFTNHKLFQNGNHPDQLSGVLNKYPEVLFYAQWNDNPPDVNFYRQMDWTEAEANCFQYYETVTEGTPVSPIFETVEELMDWVDNTNRALLSTGNLRLI